MCALKLRGYQFPDGSALDSIHQSSYLQLLISDNLGEEDMLGSKMAAVLSEESHLKDTDEIQENGDDEVEDIQEAGGDSVSKKKKKKKKKKKGQLC